jgi:hypothetical protein
MTDTANPMGAESLSESAAEQALTAAFTDKPAAPKPEAPEAPAEEAEAVEAPEDTGDELTRRRRWPLPISIGRLRPRFSVYKRWSS